MPVKGCPPQGDSIVNENQKPKTKNPIKHYSKFFCDGDVAQCLEQWGRLQSKITKYLVLKRLKFQEPWPRMTLYFLGTFEVILRLHTINLLLVMDSSQVERDFSHLNDLKDEFQSRMSHDLRLTAACLWWYNIHTKIS